jgi:hypothetical protein
MNLCGSDHRSIIPMSIGGSCIVVCVTLLKAKLNLFAPAVCLTLYSSRSDSYTVTQGPTCDPRMVESLYNRALPIRSSK